MMTPINRSRLQRAKARLAAVLQDLGENVNEYDSVSLLTLASGRHFDVLRHKGEATTDYFARLADASPRSSTRPRVPAYCGIPAQPRVLDPLHAQPWMPERHLRADEIDALPRQIGATGCGIGNGVIWSHVDR